MNKYSNCDACGKHRSTKTVIQCIKDANAIEYLKRKYNITRELQKICPSCRLSARRNSQLLALSQKVFAYSEAQSGTSSSVSILPHQATAEQDSLKDDTEEPNIKKIRLNIERCHSSHRYCIVCNQMNNLTRVSAEIQCQVFVERQLLVPAEARYCQRHLENDLLKSDAIRAIRTEEHFSLVDDKSIVDLLINMRKKILKKGINFDYLTALEDYRLL